MKVYIIRSADNPEHVLLADGSCGYGMIPNDNVGRDVEMMIDRDFAIDFMRRYHPGVGYILDEMNYHPGCDQFHPEPDEGCPFLPLSSRPNLNCITEIKN